jgi:hypothetical protein
MNNLLCIFVLLMGPAAANNRPVLTGGGSLGTIAEDHPTGVVLNQISTFLSGKATDADGNSIGMAVIGSSPGWDFYTGTTWIDFRRPAGSVGGNLLPTCALLLSASTRIRFLPPMNFNGDVYLEFKAWDGTSGGQQQNYFCVDTTVSTAYSAASANATLTVTAVNDPPYVASLDLVSRFDGVDDYINMNTTVIGGDITLEVWAYVYDNTRPWIRFMEFAGPNVDCSNNIM